MALEDDITIMDEVKKDKEKDGDKERRDGDDKDRRGKNEGRKRNETRDSKWERGDRGNNRDRRSSDRGSREPRDFNRKRNYNQSQGQGSNWDQQKILQQMQSMQQNMMGMNWAMQNMNNQGNVNPPLPPLPPPLPRDPPQPPMPKGDNNPGNSMMNASMGNTMGMNNMNNSMPGMNANSMGNMGGMDNMNTMGGMNNMNSMGMNNMSPANSMNNMNNMNPMNSMNNMNNMGGNNMPGGNGMNNMGGNNMPGGNGMNPMMMNNMNMNNMNMNTMAEMMKMSMQMNGMGGNMGPGMNMPGGGNMPVMNPSVGSNMPGNVANRAAEKLPGADELSDVMIGPVKPGDDQGDTSGMMGLIPTMDPNLAAAWGGWVMAPDGQMVRQPIVYAKSVLYPPSPNAPNPTLRNKPPGCRTIFIGGLPERADEDVIRDIFDKCGPIQTIRINNKNFAHIRFMTEAAVPNAILLSGWRLRVDNQQDQAHTGRIHVDYAQARDDQQDYERQLRQREREERHRMRMFEDMNRPPSPPTIPHYSDGEAHTVVEDLKVDAKFHKAIEILMAWLGRGDCSKRNSGMFYTMIQAANTHVKRLLSEKGDFEAEIQRLKEQWKAKIQTTTIQFDQIESVFSSASHQKVWDHFTKAQRKNIQSWKTQLTEAKTISGRTTAEEIDEMDLTDEEEEVEMTPTKAKKAKKTSTSISTLDSDKLREESENWACQANALRTEVESVKAEMSGELDEKKNQIKILQQTLQGMQKQLIEMQKRKAEEEAGPPKPKIIIPLKEAESRMLSVISTFLHSHPYPVSSDYIWSHILKIDSSVVKEDVDKVLATYKDCFSCEENSDREKTWKYVAFDTKY